MTLRLKGGASVRGGIEDSPFLGKVIAVGSGVAIVADRTTHAILEEILIQQRITNKYYSLITDEEFTVDDLEDQGANSYA